MSSDSDTKSEQDAPESLEDDANRLSDDEEFPISDDEEMISVGMKGWAGSMSKVLKSEKTDVLSKAKKVEDVAKKKEKKLYAFEIDGEVVVKAEDVKPTSLERALEKRKYKERREVNITHGTRIHISTKFSLAEQASSVQSPPETDSDRPGP